MRRWAEIGVVLFLAWIGLGGTCVDQGPVGATGGDAGSTSTHPTDDPYDEGLWDPSVDESPSHPRGIVTSGLDITGLRSIIFRADGSQEDVGDSELFLYAGNRAIIYLTVSNESGGWVPINFELCVDSTDVLAVIDPDADPPEQGAVIDGPCAVRYRDGEWAIIEQEQVLTFRSGAIEAKPQAGGGYITNFFRADFPETGTLDLFEYTVPYRVLPPGETKAKYIPRRAVLRRLIIELP